jgi:hypothetical protein
MKTAGAQESLITIERSTFRWRIERQPQWCTTDGWKGLCISVELAETPGRQLLVELPFALKERRSTPHRQRPRVSQADVETCIKQGLAAGWLPNSRGKPFRLAVSSQAHE